MAAGSERALVDAAEASAPIKIAVLLLVANCAITLGISVAAFRVFRQHSESMALWLLSASLIMFLMQAVDNVQVLSMLSLSQHCASDGGPNELYRTLAATVYATRRWAHLAELLSIEVWVLLFYAGLYRFTLVPRAVAAFGLITGVLHFVGITARAYLGYEPVVLMGAALALSHITLAIWLVIKGFADGTRPTCTELRVN